MRRHSKGIPRLCAEETSGTSLVARCLLWQGTGYGREFQRGEMVCTKTLYNYVTLGLLGKIKSIDLPLRVKRKNARKRVRERKKKFGRSIDERDPSVDERQDFGIGSGLVLGSRSKDEVLLTLVERKTRCSLIRKLPNKESASVIAAFRKLKDGMFRGCFSRVFPQHYDRQWQ